MVRFSWKLEDIDVCGYNLYLLVFRNIEVCGRVERRVGGLDRSYLVWYCVN